MIVQIADDKSVSIIDYDENEDMINTILLSKEVIFFDAHADLECLSCKPKIYRDIQAEDQKKLGLEKARSLKTLASEYFKQTFIKPQKGNDFYGDPSKWATDVIDERHFVYAAFDAVVTYLLAL